MHCRGYIWLGIQCSLPLGWRYKVVLGWRHEDALGGMHVVALGWMQLGGLNSAESSQLSAHTCGRIDACRVFTECTLGEKTSPFTEVGCSGTLREWTSLVTDGGTPSLDRSLRGGTSSMTALTSAKSLAINSAKLSSVRSICNKLFLCDWLIPSSTNNR
jgi:hypothetical protein